MSKQYNPEPINDKEFDIGGFEGLWNVDFEETQNFVKLRQGSVDGKENSELKLLHKELENKDFEVQKLQWQMTEREKELKNLYTELYRLVELNKKLNLQLNDFESLAEKQESLMHMLGKDTKIRQEPSLPKFS